jgi:hypothetical protein
MDQAVMVFDDSAARGSAIPTPSEGMVTYLEDDTLLYKYNGAAWESVTSTLSMPSGTVLQMVQNSSNAQQNTTSTSYVNASISVSITPKRADSQLIVIWAVQALALVNPSGRLNEVEMTITDSSNNSLPGAEQVIAGTLDGNFPVHCTIIGAVDSDSTATRTYKGRFRTRRNDNGGSARLQNDINRGRLVVLECIIPFVS